jgi:hypothetical protein
MAKQKRIKVFVVISPNVVKCPVSFKDHIALMKRIANDYSNTHFMDFSNDDAFNGHFEKFADEFHLNAEGANEYSNKLLNSIKN